MTCATSWEQLSDEIQKCDRCPRLREHCLTVAAVKKRAFREQIYFGKPIPNFGDSNAEVLIVGLAPAVHGANRTGRMFTGDRSGQWLYRALYVAKFANQSTFELADDGLELINCAITAAVHCAPPENKPTNDEIANCRPYLSRTIDDLNPKVFIALGAIAWSAMLLEIKQRGWYTGSKPKFSHGSQLSLAGSRLLIGSYHPSQQNTFTGRLTEPMFQSVFDAAKNFLSQGPSRNSGA